MSDKMPCGCGPWSPCPAHEDPDRDELVRLQAKMEALKTEMEASREDFRLYAKNQQEEKLRRAFVHSEVCKEKAQLEQILKEAVDEFEGLGELFADGSSDWNHPSRMRRHELIERMRALLPKE